MTQPQPMPERYRAILEQVAARHGLPAERVLAKGRKGSVTQARREALAEIRATPKLNGEPPSYPQIAAWFGRNHSSIVAAIKAHKAAAECADAPGGQRGNEGAQRNGGGSVSRSLPNPPD